MDRFFVYCGGVWKYLFIIFILLSFLLYYFFFSIFLPYFWIFYILINGSISFTEIYSLNMSLINNRMKREIFFISIFILLIIYLFINFRGSMLQYIFNSILYWNILIFINYLLRFWIYYLFFIFLFFNCCVNSLRLYFQGSLRAHYGGGVCTQMQIQSWNESLWAKGLRLNSRKGSLWAKGWLCILFIIFYW